MTSVVAALKSEDKPIVFVVDDDISVRESLELLIKFAGWHDSTNTHDASPLRVQCEFP